MNEPKPSIPQLCRCPNKQGARALCLQLDCTRQWQPPAPAHEEEQNYEYSTTESECKCRGQIRVFRGRGGERERERGKQLSESKPTKADESLEQSRA